MKGHKEVIQSGGRGLFRGMEYAHDEFVYVSTFHVTQSEEKNWANSLVDFASKSLNTK